MPYPVYNHEHLTHRISWLRAATLGANDGVISISSLLAGMLASGASADVVLTTGVAGVVAGAASMAAGEWVSVKSQADAEKAELLLEARHIRENPEAEVRELAAIYESRGLRHELALQVAQALSEHDALDSHARDELGITHHSQARPMQAAVASAISFVSGGLLPVGVAWGTSVIQANVMDALSILTATSVACLMATGAIVAKASNASAFQGAIRVGIWGALSMVLGALAGKLIGVELG